MVFIIQLNGQMHLQLGISGMAEGLDSKSNMTYLEAELARQQSRQLQFIREELIANVSDLIKVTAQSDFRIRRQREGRQGNSDSFIRFS